MNIESVKSYLNALPLVQEIPNDDDLGKFINLAEILFEIYYTLDT